VRALPPPAPLLPPAHSRHRHQRRRKKTEAIWVRVIIMIGTN
jgi:hypothetical protein